MKEWWFNLSLREKQTVASGGAVVALFLLYIVIWAPLTNKVENLRQQIQSKQNLLSWMQESDLRIQKLEKSQHAHTKPSTASLLNTVQTEINKTTMAKNLTELQQADNEAVQLRFKKVNFDDLIKWLIQLSQQHALAIQQFTTTPSTSPGLVDVELKLQAI